MKQPVIDLASVWAWNRPAVDPAKAVKSRRIRASIQAVVMGAIAAFLFTRAHALSHWIAGFAGVMGVLTLAGGWLIPPLFHALETFGQALAKGVTACLTWLLLVPFFYIFFLPARGILMLRKNDPMHREWEKDRSSYWIDRPRVTEPAHYTRQY